jgi:glycosyltransferase involved in cell wall biosynthesis
MIVHFFEPPPAKKIGGLEQAIRSIEAFLTGAGVTVRSNAAITELGKSGGPELVHFHGIWEPAFLRVSAHCRRNNIPYVVSPHGMLEPWVLRFKRWKKRPWFALFERRHLAGASLLLTTSQMESNNLAMLLPSARCVAVPLGLSGDTVPDYEAARKELGWGAGETVLLYLSRVHPKKGLHMLLPALCGVEPDAKRNTRLVIVGGGEPGYIRQLNEFVARNQARLPRIEWAGEIWSDRKWRYFQGADLFCLPSHSENFGLAVLEALQVGTRVLTTDTTPWGEVADLHAGYVVQPTESAILAAFHRFFADSGWSNENRNSLAAEIHHRYRWESVGPAYVTLYEDILRDGRPSHGPAAIQPREVPAKGASDPSVA